MGWTPVSSLAAALHAGCSTYLTDDRALPRIPGIAIRQLTDYASARRPS